MKDTPPHLKDLEEIERECIPGLVEALRQEGLEAVRRTLRDMTGWHEDYDDPRFWRDRVPEEQKRIGWEIQVSTEDTRHGIVRGPPAAGYEDNGRSL